MGFKLDSSNYVEYLKDFYSLLQEKKDYVTGLDLATGDGDHWLNMNTGFGEVIKIEEELKEMTLQNVFKKIGMILMSKIGGSSGVLYGGAYMAASKVLGDVDYIGKNELYEVYSAMLEDIMKRGKTEVGQKTMVDALAPVVDKLKEQIDGEANDKDLLEAMAKAALDGAEATKDMPAIRGRASYQTNKGVGHLDPGAVTMAYQIEVLSKYILNS